ncbi:MAG: hypothetical protein CL678_02130 [Bdellovibrionaceae bacterium]|nr:hypothetical protein [Pseudobdellovibrionaceae bacterium]
MWVEMVAKKGAWKPYEGGRKMKKKIKLGDLIPDDVNANKGNPRGLAAVESSLQKYGAARSVVLDKDNRILAGNKTWEAAGAIGLENVQIVETTGDTLVAVKRLDISIDSPRGRALAIADNRAGEVGLTWDGENLAHLSTQVDLLEFWTPGELEALNLPDLSAEDPAGGDLGDPDEVPEIQEEPISKRGDLWILGEHRVLCGDSTNADDVARLMDGERAALLHADPPYGMGKECDGVANDNLYREKLDAFQMRWWSAFRPHLEDNASAYIWGNAEDLWRLWYVGGLSTSERLTFRNEVVWAKGSAGAGGISHIGAEGLRQYPNETERALFFMLGEQGFNNNADNYWEGWEPIRKELEASVAEMGWTAADVKRITGVGMFGHWFTRSQWSFIPEKHYNALRDAARGDAFKREHDAFKREHDAFKREHDALKRDFYATRAHFDNTHDNMTDVWEFPRVTGGDRHGHATPKPVDAMRRAIKSSSRAGDIIVEPFGGSGSTMIAAESEGRKSCTMELLPVWVDVIVRRWQEYTGKAAVHADGATFEQLAKQRLGSVIEGAI